MTCIVGLAHEGTVWIGGDSAGVDSRYALTVRKDEKVFRNSEFVMGFTSSFRMGQLLRYALKPPRRHGDDDLMTYMVTEFVNSVRQCLKDGGYARKEKEEEAGGTFLVGVAGRLFTISDDYQVGEPAVPFDAVGCGDLIAIGAMYATEGQPPRDRIETALKAAEAWSAGVRGPFTILNSSGDAAR